MGKRTEFARDTIEVCRNCKAEGSVYGRTEDGRSHVREICPVCCGSGLVRKHIEGFVAVEPYDKTTARP